MFGALTEPASSIVNPTCIKNTNLAVTTIHASSISDADAKLDENNSFDIFKSSVRLDTISDSGKHVSTQETL